MAWSDGLSITYDYLPTGDLWKIRETGATSGQGVLATFAYNDLGPRKTLTRGNGTITNYGYDPVSRLQTFNLDLPNTAQDQTYSFIYNSAGQISSRTANNNSYAFNGAVNVDRSYTVNGLNQYTAAGQSTFDYDLRGNLTRSSTIRYGYNSLNQMISATTQTSLVNGMAYDGLGRMMQITNANDNRFVYDGGNLATQLKVTSGVPAISRRYVWGPGADELIATYEGASKIDRRWPLADERGSIVAITDNTGAATAINTYDEFGIPGAISGQIGYAGQVWLSSVGLSYNKARMYSPSLGRFMQTDPIGYSDGMNWYDYVGGDPINNTDPSGLCPATIGTDSEVLVGDCPGKFDNYVALFNFAGPVYRYNAGAEAQSRAVVGSREAMPQDGDLVCKGPVTFSAVGPLPQAGGDSAFAPGTKPANGTVAIAGAQTFGFGRRALREGAAARITIMPEGLDDVLRATGGPQPPYTVGDYGDVNIRKAPGSRFDIYRFSTLKGALAFGKRTVPATIRVPAGGHCPPGTSAK